MSELAFQQSQLAFAAHLRDPESAPAPAAIEDRRLGIYRDLIYNNIEGFISGGFPILRQILADAHWHSMMRDFVARHQSHSPYFLEISQEFLRYLQEERGLNPASREDPPFMLELAHYEWVELALDVAEGQWPESESLERIAEPDVLAGLPLVSPFVWPLSYQYPVHRLGPDYQPQNPADSPIFLLVYRTRNDEVRFMESNSATVRLLQLLSDAEEPLTGEQALQQLAHELQTDLAGLLGFGQDLLSQLRAEDIICAIRPAA